MRPEAGVRGPAALGLLREKGRRAEGGTLPLRRRAHSLRGGGRSATAGCALTDAATDAAAATTAAGLRPPEERGWEGALRLCAVPAPAAARPHASDGEDPGPVHHRAGRHARSGPGRRLRGVRRGRGRGLRHRGGAGGGPGTGRGRGSRELGSWPRMLQTQEMGKRGQMLENRAWNLDQEPGPCLPVSAGLEES